MKSLIPEYKGLDIETIESLIVNKDNNELLLNNEDLGIDGNKIIYDLLYEAYLPNSNNKIGFIINIEPQGEINTPYPLYNRALYYVSRLISRQGNDYSKLIKVYSIWISFSSTFSSIVRYSTKQDIVIGNINSHVDYDYTNIVFINIANDIDDILIKYGVNDNTSLLDLLNLLLSRNKQLDEPTLLKLENDYDIILTKEDIKSMSWSDLHINLAKAEGKIENSAFCIHNLMSSLNLTFEQALDALRIDDSIKDQVIKTYKDKYTN